MKTKEQRYIELKKLNRYELNQISQKIGFNSYPGSTTYLSVYRYEPYPIEEARQDIIKEEKKRGLIKMKIKWKNIRESKKR